MSWNGVVLLRYASYGDVGGRLTVRAKFSRRASHRLRRDGTETGVKPAARLWEAFRPWRGRFPYERRRQFSTLVPRRLVVCAHAAGFFSNFNKVMNHLVHSRTLPGIKPIVAD